MNHYLYRIINRENNKFYVGIHSTKKYYYDTKYYGSGCFSKDAKKNPDKYLRVLITQAESREELVALEVLFVTQELVDDPMCYNLKLGGIGAGIGNTNGRGGKGTKKPPRTAEQKANASAAMKGNKNSLGCVHTDEHNAAKSVRVKEWWRLRKLNRVK
jgi:hypothetical protein